MKNIKNKNNKSCNNKNHSENERIKSYKKILYDALYDHNSNNDINLEDELSYYKAKIKNKKLNNNNKIAYSDKIKKNKKIFFPQYDILFKEKKKSSEEKNNDLLINNFLFKGSTPENKNKNKKSNNKNNDLFTSYNTINKNNNKIDYSLFSETKNESLLNTIKNKNIKENNIKKTNYKNNIRIIYSLNNNLSKNLSPYSCQNNKSVKKFPSNSMNILYNNHYNINSNEKYDGNNFQKYIKEKGDRILSIINNNIHNIHNLHQIGTIKNEKHIIFPANPFKFH
jgi:hypothetical protein